MRSLSESHSLRVQSTRGEKYGLDFPTPFSTQRGKEPQVTTGADLLKVAISSIFGRVHLPSLGRKDCLQDGREPAAVCGRAIVIPNFDRGPDPGDLDVRKFVLLRGDGERRIPYGSLLPVDDFPPQVNSLLFVCVKGDPILYRPDGANGTYVCPLRAQQGV